MEKRLRREGELAAATAAFPPRGSFRQRVNRQATAMRADRLAGICSPADALEGVAALRRRSCA